MYILGSVSNSRRSEVFYAALSRASLHRALSCAKFPAAVLSFLSLALLFTGCSNGLPGAAPAPTVAIVASPTSINAGGSATLTVTASNATKVTVTGTDGSSYNLPASGGTQSVKPASTTTYTASASGPGGSVSATATIDVSSGPVTPAPTVTIVASPTSINLGGSATLNVAATNATQVTVTGSDGSTYKLQPTGGTQSVTPGATTTYTATAVGSGGKISATATVTVISGPVAPAPTVSIAANPSSINAGSSTTLTVTATNATQVTITGTDGSSYQLQPNGGEKTVTPAATTTYTATAIGAGGKVSANTVVVVDAVPAPTVTITANPRSISSGSSSVLTVSAANANTVTVTGSDGSKYALAPGGGTQSVTPTATTTYTATATAGAISVTATATVTVVPPVAPTVTITANPTTIAAGSSSTLTVTATNATQVTVTGSDNSSYTLQPDGGSPSVTPAATTTYTATATGPGGHVTATATVTVTPDTPTVTITANPTSVDQGSSSILTVTATHATQVTLTGSDGSTYTLSPSGGTESVDPNSSTTYTATATGAGGTATANTALTVVVTNPKPTVTIAASPSSINVGGSSTLTVGSSYANQVTISGSDGSSYTLTGTSGTQAVSPTATTTYTATATGTGGSSTATATVTVTKNPSPTVTIVANPAQVSAGSPSTLTVTATNATAVTITGSDNSSYTLSPTGGNQSVTPTSTTTYTATATGGAGTTPATAEASVTVGQAGVDSINHVIFMLQENHTFDNYFGMLNPYRAANGFSVGDDGVTYTVDGIDDKLSTISNKDDEGTVYPLFKFATTCIDDMSSAWLESYGDVNTYNFLSSRSILMDGFVHNAEGFAKACAASGTCAGNYTDTTGQRSMGYYDQGFLNYYYYMASQFAVSDRWFSPISSKSVSNRIATMTGGTTQGLVYDPGSNDNLSALNIPNIYQELDTAKVSWKIYYTSTEGFCAAGGICPGGGSNADYPATYFSHLTYAYQYLHGNPTGGTCTAPTVSSSAVGDTTNSFCIDPTHIAPLNDPTYGYFADLTNSNLPSFAFIEAGYGLNDEHPGSNASILGGQQEVAKVVNAFMASPQWKDSVFFLSYDEGGGPYDHVPPVPTHTNDYTDASQKPNYPIDISSIAVNPDSYNPCLPPNPPGTPTLHCDLRPGDPGSTTGDAAAASGFAAQLGFRLPNMIISPFTRRHYVGHTPMDHTAVIKFVESRFLGSAAHLTARDAAQPNLLDFFDFNKVPWATPPTPPTPNSATNTCTPASM
jgi:phospholipase C